MSDSSHLQETSNVELGISKLEIELAGSKEQKILF